MTHIRLFAASLTLGVMFGSSAAGARPQADPEHARLTAMTGVWNVELTFLFQPAGAPIKTNGTSTIRSILGGLFIEETIEGTLNGRAFTTLAWTGFNTDAKQYEATRIASTNTARIVETGSYDDKTRQFVLKADYPLAGEMWHQRTVIQQISPDSMIATSYLSFGAVPEWKGVEIRYTRKPQKDVRTGRP